MAQTTGVDIDTVRIKNIVFDVGEVLVDWNPRYLYRKIFDDEGEMEQFLENVCTWEWNIRQDSGYPWDKALQEKIAEFPQYEAEILAYKSRWPEMVAGIVQGSADMLLRLKAAGYGIFAITNYNEETFALSQELWPVLAEFEGVIVSGEEKCVKPDPKIYRLLFERYDLNPEECVFIDDRLDNVQGAEKQGMRAIHFKDPVQTKKELVDLIGLF